jgi:cellulose synthase (UDP-forming)
MDDYFSAFEHRTPPAPLVANPWIHALGQFFLVNAVVLGGWYLHWRWTESLNVDALWFSIPLVLAESGAYIGLLLFVFNIWRIRDTPQCAAPSCITECVREGEALPRSISVDVYFPTYDEDPELVKLSLQDAQKIAYPHAIDIRIYVLDDGNRPRMRNLAEALGCHYITRTNNIGFKAGNLRNAMEQSTGDFILICDADTRPFSTILENTLGYFTDPDVAWVQTPQWFFDIPEGHDLEDVWERRLGTAGRIAASAITRTFGKISVGHDPFVNDPQMFYDVIQRRRNWANASFCCGAGSVHRREATMQAALRTYGIDIVNSAQKRGKTLRMLTGESVTHPDVLKHITTQTMMDTEFTPYKFHVSEDIYTSIELHSDTARDWKSVMHPKVESKMLSPQDLLTWTTQRFKYAGGTLDIALNDHFLWRRGLSWSQRLMYGSTVWSYLGALWNVVFLISPIIYLFLAVAPVSAFSHDFYKHIFPFLVATELGMLFSMWGLSMTKFKYSYLAFFPVNLQALWTVLRGRKISFPVTPKARQDGTYLRLVWPQVLVCLLTAAGIVYAWLLFATGSSAYGFDGLFLNTFWGLVNIIALSTIVTAAVWKPTGNQHAAALDSGAASDLAVSSLRRAA